MAPLDSNTVSCLPPSLHPSPSRLAPPTSLSANTGPLSPATSPLSPLLEFFLQFTSGSQTPATSNLQAARGVCKALWKKPFPRKKQLCSGRGFQIIFLQRNLIAYFPSPSAIPVLLWGIAESSTSCNILESSWHHFPTLFTHWESDWPFFLFSNGPASALLVLPRRWSWTPEGGFS